MTKTYLHGLKDNCCYLLSNIQRITDNFFQCQKCKRVFIEKEEK